MAAYYLDNNKLMAKSELEDENQEGPQDTGGKGPLV